MAQPHELIVGRIYFQIYYEDEYLRHPFVHTYEYCGPTEQGDYEFRHIGTGDFYLLEEGDLESVERLEEFVTSLKEWGRQNPDLLP